MRIKWPQRFLSPPFLRSFLAWVGFTNNHKDMGIVQDSWFSASEKHLQVGIFNGLPISRYYMAMRQEPKVQLSRVKILSGLLEVVL